MTDERRISDEAVRKRTGKSWSQWFGILDRWGAAKKGHRKAARYLGDRHGLEPWWAQAVTVRYERDRAGRPLHQRASGAYEITVSRVIAAPTRRVFECLVEPTDLSKWFARGSSVEARVGGLYRNRDGDRGEFLAIRKPKLLRFTWENPRHAPGTVVEIALAARGRGKVTAALTHRRLRTQRDAAKMKEAWNWAMDSLRSYVETGRPVAVEAWERARKKAGSRATRPAG